MALAVLAPAARAVDVTALAAWADAHFGKAYAEGGAFSGAGMIVVQGGEVVLTRIYGQAEQGASPRAIDPSSTTFLIGSATKTFTGLAIAQLVERGLVRSIEDPANRYLKRARIPGADGDAVTIKDLLTHSAGYDLRNRGTSSMADVPTPLAPAEIARLAPDRVRATGGLVSYSNYSTGLLAILVEDLSGQDIEAYFRQHIWLPLGMRTTSFQRGPTLDRNTAQAFRQSSDGSYSPAYFHPFHPFYWPVGGVRMSLQDAAAYLRFLLAGARGADHPVISAQRLAEIRSVLRSNHPAVGGFGYQMMSWTWNGHALFGHGGTWPGYESMLVVSPDDDVAVFYSVVGPARISNLTTNPRLFEQLFGPYAPAAAARPVGSVDLPEYVGSYRPAMRSYRGIEGALAFAGGAGDALRVEPHPQGLTIGGDGPWLPLGQDVFWHRSPGVAAANPFVSPIFAFKRDAAGRITHVTGLYGLAPYEKVPDWQDPAIRIQGLTWIRWLLGLGVLALGWPWAGGLAGWRDRLSLIACLLPVAGAWLMWVPLFTYGGPGGISGYVLQGLTPRFLVAAMVGNLTVLSAAWLVWATWREPTRAASRPGSVRRLRRWHLGAMAALTSVAAALMVSMQTWGLGG